MNADAKNKQDSKSERVKLHFAETAKKIILKDGVEAVSVRKVASLAGYSYATIYNHFKNLDELLWYSRNIMIKDIYQYLQSLNVKRIDTLTGVINLFKKYMDYYIQNPNVFRFFYFHHLDASARPEVNYMDEINFQKQYISTFEYLIKSGKVSAGEVTALIKILIYSVHGMLTLYISDNDDLKVEDLYHDLNNMICCLIKE